MGVGEWERDSERRRVGGGGVNNINTVKKNLRYSPFTPSIHTVGSHNPLLVIVYCAIITRSVFSDNSTIKLY